MIQGSIFNEVYVSFITHKKGEVYFVYDGFEYRYCKRSDAYVRSDGIRVTKSCTFFKTLSVVKTLHTSRSWEERVKAKRKLGYYNKDSKFVVEDRRRKSKVKAEKLAKHIERRNEISWSNHYLKIKETQTRKTSDGFKIKVGNMIITVKDESKIESVRKRFEQHEIKKMEDLKK